MHTNLHLVADPRRQDGRLAGPGSPGFVAEPGLPGRCQLGQSFLRHFTNKFTPESGHENLIVSEWNGTGRPGGAISQGNRAQFRVRR